MLSTLYDTYFLLSMHLKMLSAISFNLDQSKIFSSGNGLKLPLYFNFKTLLCLQPHIMISANVPSAKKIIVHGPDLTSIPSQFPIHEVSF